MVTGHVTLKLLDVVRHEQHGQTPTTWLSGTSHFENLIQFVFCYPFCFDKKTHTHTTLTQHTQRERRVKKVKWLQVFYCVTWQQETWQQRTRPSSARARRALPKESGKRLLPNPTAHRELNWTEPNNPQARYHRTNTTYSRRSTTTTTNNNNRVCFSSWFFLLLQQNRLFFFFIRGRVTHLLA